MKENILIGVTGGIACYKIIEVVNQLKKEGFNVQVIMTRSAQEFVTPLTFHTMSGNKVVTEIFDTQNQSTTKHIDLAKEADILVIAPATANIIGKIANGIADDMLTTTLLAFRGKKLIFPAMNTAMLENSIVQENIQKLKKHNYQVFGTAEGELACGDFGSGKLLPWEDIVRIIKENL